jgi:cbb3-type cytochrome oxidase subunit 3
VRLSDIMSAMGLAAFPQIGMVIFVIVFVAITVRVFGRRRPEVLERYAGMALNDDREGVDQ